MLHLKLILLLCIAGLANAEVTLDRPSAPIDACRNVRELIERLDILTDCEMSERRLLIITIAYLYNELFYPSPNRSPIEFRLLAGLGIGGVSRPRSGPNNRSPTSVILA